MLRLYKGSKTASEDTPRDSFDIEVDLQSRNWYVHLWSPEESLYADLSLKRNDGTLIHLVRSQVVHMPRTRPTVAIDQRFMKVEATERRAEIVPTPALHVQSHPPQEGVAILPNELYASPIVKPIDSAQIVREILKEVYAPLHWGGSHPEPETLRATSTPPTERAATDLTAMAERHLSTGLSSGVLQKNRMEGGRDSKR